MTLTAWTRVIAAIITLAVIGAVGVSWRAEMRNREELTAELASTKQALRAADARQSERDAKLADTLAAIAAQKRAVQSPAQILKALPLQLPLPLPITVQEVSGSAVARQKTGNGSAGSTAVSGDAAPATGDLTKVQGVIPGPDLKPLYDFALDCQACQAKLAASQSDLADEQGKTKALTKERDDALRVARGGSIWKRVGRAAKWMLIGAAAGAVAARTVH